jgi:DnaJ-domain-containing protein 1
MTEQQILLLGILFAVGFAVVFATFSVVERRRASAADQRKPFASEESDRTNSKDESQEREANSQPRKSRWFEVLGVDENASLVTIQQAYRKQISQYHPDKIVGMAEELRELANQRTVEINEAYQLAKRHSNMK